MKPFVEIMADKRLHVAAHGCDEMSGGLYGIFKPSHKLAAVTVIAAAGEGWDHVSVSTPYAVPDYDQMKAVAELFFLPTETAMQLHVPVCDHINNHEYVLHWWRPHDVDIPRPPIWMV